MFFFILYFLTLFRVSQVHRETELLQEKDALKGFIKQLSGHSNFQWFSAMNLIQVQHIAITLLYMNLIIILLHVI